MALQLVVDLGSATANSYLTVAEADARLAMDLHDSTWRLATLDDKARALLLATRYLDERFDWHGTKATFSQALRWPRHGVSDVEGFYVPATQLPDVLKQATAYLAQQLIRSSLQAGSEASASGISRIKVGSIELAFKDQTVQPPTVVLPEHILVPLAVYGRFLGTSGDGPRGVVRA